jgi:hypothetical protein
MGLAVSLTRPTRLVAQSAGYTVTDLGPVGTPFSLANFLNNHGLVTGSDTLLDGQVPRSHAVLWHKNLFLDLKQITDIRQPGLLGPNSTAGPVNDAGPVVVGAHFQIQTTKTSAVSVPAFNVQCSCGITAS